VSVYCDDDEMRILKPHKSNKKKIPKCYQLMKEIEIVSPTIEIKHIRVLYDVLHLGIIKNFDFYSNDTTSNHVHMTCGEHFKTPKHLYKICSAWYYFEPVFFFLCNKDRHNNTYCRSMRSILKNRPPSDITEKNMNISKIRHAFQGNEETNRRYAALNLENLKEGGHGTIECRLKECCSDIKELQAWVYLLAVFYCRAITSDKISRKMYKSDDFMDLINDATKFGNNDIYTNFWEFINIPALELYWSTKKNIKSYITSDLISESIFKEVYPQEKQNADIYSD
jgi:Putative amidoligase enzyme